ncbi:MAG: hypothetical protein NC543_02385 [bacterium]|nr:hypothetical protein [bacterium]MCM1374210.1 hypothetical protein [Muribaculum sp.]
MKKWICVLSVFWGYMLWMLPVRADVIVSPNDSFFAEHSSECEYVGSRTYTANGPDGVVILYASPVSAQKVATWENGHKANISFTYEDERGTLWGICEDGDIIGWMPMEYMDVVYDSVSFEQEYAAEIQQQEGELDEQYLDQEIYFWRYPASSSRSSMTIMNYPPQYDQTYTDSEGHRWGNVGYYYGYRNCWICLDMPDAEFDALYPDTAPGIGETQPVEKDFTGERITPEGGQGNVVALVAVMVLLVVLITAVLLLILKRKGQQRPPQKEAR